MDAMTEALDLFRPVLSREKIRVSKHTAHIFVPGAAQPACEPHIDLVREGDVIRAIDVTCSCGRKMRLKVEY